LHQIGIFRSANLFSCLPIGMNIVSLGKIFDFALELGQSFFRRKDGRASWLIDIRVGRFHTKQSQIAGVQAGRDHGFADAPLNIEINARQALGSYIGQMIERL